MPLRNRHISVLLASSEVSPYAKTGGLGDVLGSLPGALQGLGLDVSVVMPAFRSVLKGQFAVERTDIPMSVLLSERIETGEVLKGKTADGVPIYFVKANKYFDREALYGTSEGDYADNTERFTFFSRAILEVAKRLHPDVIHANDWQTALSLAFLRAQPDMYEDVTKAKTVMTIHNLGYQGRFWSADWHLLNLDWSFFTPQRLEFHGDINFLKGGVVFADEVTTVSPSYAKEIQTAEQGFGLEGVFQERTEHLTGILNGVDYRIWDPGKDRYIARDYTADDLTGKSHCKQDLQKELGLRVSESTPVVGMVTRLSDQKGLDLVSLSIQDFITRGCQFVLLGSGDRDLEDSFRTLAAEYPGSAGIRLGFSETLAHKIIAGSDILLMPSRYEPGGLTQLYAMRYGTIPLVRATGGLKDTVVPYSPKTNTGNGFVFKEYDTESLLDALDTCLKTFQKLTHWRGVIRNAMMSDFSWEHSARAYVRLYERLLS